MREFEHLLPDLAPPPGGLARLQRILQTRQRPRHALPWRWLPAMAAACALSLLTIVWLPGVIQRQRHVDALTQALRQAMLPARLDDGIRVADGAALPLPSGQANARVYLVVSASPSAH